MNHEKLSIKSWSEDDKPREKLVLKGSTTLSHAELLAILIGSGNRTDSAVELSKKINLSAYKVASSDLTDVKLLTALSFQKTHNHLYCQHESCHLSERSGYSPRQSTQPYLSQYPRY